MIRNLNFILNSTESHWRFKQAFKQIGDNSQPETLVWLSCCLGSVGTENEAEKPCRRLLRSTRRDKGNLECQNTLFSGLHLEHTKSIANGLKKQLACQLNPSDQEAWEERAGT